MIEQEAFAAAVAAAADPLSERLAPEQLISPKGLADIELELMRESAMRQRLYPGWINNGRLESRFATVQLRRLVGAIQAIHLLREPIVNTTIAAMMSVPSEHQAVLNQVALALLDAGNKRHKLVLLLRTAMDEAT